MAVLHLYDDPDGSGEKLGQCQESGRDQGHAMLCCALMGYFCKMAYNIGEDLFAYDNGRVVAMAEYVAKYNVFKPEFAGQVPGGNNEWFSYTREVSRTLPISIVTSRWTSHRLWSCVTTVRKPVVAANVPYGICGTDTAKSGYACQILREFASRLRPDAGPEQYGGSGGALDQLGYSTLMFYYE